MIYHTLLNKGQLNFINKNQHMSVDFSVYERNLCNELKDKAKFNV